MRIRVNLLVRLMLTPLGTKQTHETEQPAFNVVAHQLHTHKTMLQTFDNQPKFPTNTKGELVPCIKVMHRGTFKQQHYLCVPTGIVNVAKPHDPPKYGIKHTVRRCHPDGRVIMRVRMSKKQRLARRHRDRDRLHGIGKKEVSA